jgi:hypothetical protein
MTVSNPDFLMTFNESSGRPVTNYGSKSGGYSIGTQAAEGTDFSWHQGQGPYTASGYLESLINASPNAAMVFLSTTAGGYSNSLENINVALGFRTLAFSNNQVRLVMPNGSVNTTDGNVLIELSSPAGSGDFDLLCRFRNDGGGELAFTTVSALSFGVDYTLAASIDVSTPTACVGRFKFGSNSVETPATVNFNTMHFESGIGPYILRRSDFPNYYGHKGRLNMFAYQRGAAAWSSQDLIDIVSNPATAITGWPAGGASPGPLFVRRQQVFVNDVIHQG